MDSTSTRFAAAVAKPNQQPRRAQPARLPQTTAELGNWMLAARCGTGR
jgi:hypothetical protein